MGRRPTGHDPLKIWVNTTWHNMRRRAQVDFTRKEFADWAEQQRAKILSMRRPSIDRIDPWGHYFMDNIQVIPLSENAAQGSEVKCINKTNELEREHIKYCVSCGLRITRNQWLGGRWEPSRSFIKRLTCGKSCSMILRKRNTAGRIQNGHRE